jgi:hypothetical protein
MTKDEKNVPGPIVELREAAAGFTVRLDDGWAWRGSQPNEKPDPTVRAEKWREWDWAEVSGQPVLPLMILLDAAGRQIGADIVVTPSTRAFPLAAWEHVTSVAFRGAAFVCINLSRGAPPTGYRIQE